MTNYEIKNNEQYGSKEIYFNEKPEAKIIKAMKEKKMRWNPKKSCWYGFIEDADIQEIFGENALVIPEAKFVNGYGLYDGWEGGKNRQWRSDKELKQFLLDDFKKAGIKASVRFNRAGYLTSITVTIKISEEDIKTYEEWAQLPFDVSSGWNCYTDENGKIDNIFGEKFYSLPDEERKVMYENIKNTAYNLRVEHLKDTSYSFSDIDVLREEASRKYNLVKEIVASYNRDCTNSQIDYFDRDIYDHYTFKIA